MSKTIKALIAKAWKGVDVDLAPGIHEFDETVVVRITGTVEKHCDELVARKHRWLSVVVEAAVRSA